MFSKDLAKPQARRALAAGDVRLSHAARDRRLSQSRVCRSKPYPVDWRTRGPEDALRAFPTLGDGLRRTDTAVREWVGLMVYWLTGRSSELFPGPCRLIGR